MGRVNINICVSTHVLSLRVPQNLTMSIEVFRMKVCNLSARDSGAAIKVRFTTRLVRGERS